MERTRIVILLEQHLNGVIAQKESDELNLWLERVDVEEFEETIAACRNIPEKYKNLGEITVGFRDKLEKELNALDEDNTEKIEVLHHLKPRRYIYWLRYAAVFLLLGGAGLYLFTLNKNKDRQMGETLVSPDIVPGKKGAILTLADGRQIQLDSLAKGRITVQNGAEVILNNDELAYNAVGASISSKNTIMTPRGRVFTLVLPDGTHVWLNAESSITYPTAFVGSMREVSVSGELYFEVAKNAQKPFIVKVNDKSEIKVLGTDFNINAYNDDGYVKTTLLSGAIQVNANTASYLLKPGQQAKIDHGTRIKVIEDADIDQVIAWKNGLFNFSGHSVSAIMREIGRWYDLEVEFETIPEPGEIMGGLDRNLSLPQVINILKKININCRVEGRKLIVTK